MAPIRLRYPSGVTTIQVDFDTATVGDLQRLIFRASDISPPQQEIRSGYPPQTLTTIPALPLSSLGLKPGEQIIVNQKISPPTGTYSQPSIPIQATSGASPASRWAAAPPTTGPAAVETPSGVLVHRVVPDDNSCLFSSVALIFEQDIAKAQKMRQIVADGIRRDTETYNNAILGMPREQYVATILKPSTWGGAIELGILAKHFETEIASVDIETGRIDRFTPPLQKSSGNRCLLVYSGIHYDAVTLAPVVNAPLEWDQTVFPIMATDDDNDQILGAAKKLATILRERRAFTNVATFDLKCEQCGKGLKGEKDARAHAQETGHVRFGEY
ncbi:hypothetical protein SCLCIDRAFT_120261 [Scleroderma citrinum Foug A]|uniref:Ubiquitin thioesterase OTU n=1 Tax=Scleroderma citrinum Foug A TaxID=1036808 RepID=A0A0C3E276_9AGAM|nr:hypothetical protein SCLCIDRAFT_120261 [Scleroderma citrinum Foug A]